MFLFDEKYRTFEMFSLSHLLVVLLVIAIISLIIVFRKKLRNCSTIDIIFRKTIAITMLIMELVFILWNLNKGDASLDLLPFGLCAISMYTTSIVLLTDNEKLFRVIFPWAVTGAVLSLIVADLRYDFPHFRFFHYFGNHSFFLIAQVYLVFVKEYKMKYRHILHSSGILIFIAFILYFLNKALGTNYMFLAQLPAEVEGMFSWLGKLWVWGFGVAIFILFNLWYLLFYKLPKAKWWKNQKAGEQLNQ
jgi:hypothetical integral membrane protein (TIGR02206 family)